MLIHRQNSVAPGGKRRPGSHEAQSHGTGQQSKNSPCVLKQIQNIEAQLYNTYTENRN
jgi:hypothetical protein